MRIIPIMINGLPGSVTTVIAGHLAASSGFRLLPFSLTGPEITDSSIDIGGLEVQLVQEADRVDAILRARQEAGEPFISVDFTHPSAVNHNAAFYCEQGLPFVMGTTGGDRQQLAETVEQSGISAVIAPNMAKQVVGFQAMLEHAAENYPGLFDGYTMRVRESHQQGKADTSGTAKAVVGCFNRLGIDFDVEEIEKIRDPEIQRHQWGIPNEYLGGHGWHTYTLVSADGTVQFAFTHNISGRDIYAGGTMDAARFLDARIAEGSSGTVYSMIDVLESGKHT